MSIFVMRLQPITRRQSRSVVAAAAYRSASRLYDERRGKAVDFTGKEDVVYSALLLPPGAERFAADRGAFWNAVDRREIRRDARLALEFVIALPEALERADQTHVARSFAEEAFVRLGLGVDLNLHDPQKTDGLRNPHAHLMTTTRTIRADREAETLTAALDRKVAITIRDLRQWRALLAEHANARLAERGFDRRLDPLSFRRQGLALEPRFRLSMSSRARLEEGRATRQGEKLLDLAGRNGERIIADPLAALRAISREQTVFSEADLHRFLSRHAEDPGQLALAQARVLGDENLVDLGRDKAGVRQFASREEVERETAAVAAGKALAGAGRLLTFEASDPREALARARSLEPTRPAALLVVSPERRRDMAKSLGAQTLSESEALTALGSGALKGAVLIVMDAELLRAAPLGAILAAAEGADLWIHLLGGARARAPEASTGAAVRALFSWTAGRDGARWRASTDLSADETPARRFARLRGLSGGRDERGEAGLAQRRRRDGEAALERRRAALSAQRAREADGAAERRRGLERRLDILGPAPVRTKDGPEL